MKNNNRGVMLKPSGFCLCGESIFFLQQNMNMLVEMDSDLKKIKMVKHLSNNIYGYPSLYNDFCICVNNEIYVFANSSKDIFIFDLKERELKTCSLMTGKNRIFVNKAMHLKNNSIILLPNGDTQKIYIDCDSKVCAYKNIGSKIGLFLEKCYVVEHNKFVFADSSGNNIHILDQNFDYLDSCRVGKDNSRYWGIIAVGDYYILPQMDENKATVYDKRTKSYTELDYPNNYVSRKGYGYSNMYAFGNKVYIFPMFANMIISVDVERMTVQQEFAEENLSVKYSQTKTEIIAETYVDSFIVDDNVIVYEDMFECWHKFNCRNNTVEVVELSKDQEQNYIDELRVVVSSNNQECIINESVGLNSLDNFIFSLNKVK